MNPVVDDSRAAFQHTRDHVRPYSTSRCCSSTSGAAMGGDEIANPDVEVMKISGHDESVAEGLVVVECEDSSDDEADASRLVAPVGVPDGFSPAERRAAATSASAAGSVLPPPIAPGAQVTPPIGSSAREALERRARQMRKRAVAGAQQEATARAAEEIKRARHGGDPGEDGDGGAGSDPSRGGGDGDVDRSADGAAEGGHDPVEGEGAEYFDLDDGLEEARQLRTCPPCEPLPSADEIRKHKASGHSPYRSWCSICVWGAANDRPHPGRAELPASACPEVHADYTFFRNRRGDKKTAPTLVSTDRGHGCVAAHVVPKKGRGGGWIVQQTVRDMKKWGIRGKAILRSDGEFSIVDLLDRVGHMRQGETLQEQTPKGDSRANGRAERAVQKLQKKVRVLKLAMEENFKVKLDVQHPAFTWLVELAADVLTKTEVGLDGRTPWERLKSRPYSGLVMEFGTQVLYRVPCKPVGG